MTRLFITEFIPSGKQNIVLESSQGKYIKNVLRMRKGEAIIICDQDQMDHICVIDDLSTDEVKVSVILSEKNQAEPDYHVTLFQGVAKGERMDYCIQKSVELGVYEIVPVQCDRSVVQFKSKDKQRKILRWQKIAQEAARQSGRGMIPCILSPKPFGDAINDVKNDYDVVLFPWENASELQLPHILDNMPLKKENQECLKIAIFIGPEGGFSDEEASQANQTGAQVVSLGRRILRTETAGPAILAMLLYRLDLM